MEIDDCSNHQSKGNEIQTFKKVLFSPLNRKRRINSKCNNQSNNTSALFEVQHNENRDDISISFEDCILSKQRKRKFQITPLSESIPNTPKRLNELFSPQQRKRRVQSQQSSILNHSNVNENSIRSVQKITDKENVQFLTPKKQVCFQLSPPTKKCKSLNICDELKGIEKTPSKKKPKRITTPKNNYCLLKSNSPFYKTGEAVLDEHSHFYILNR